ncbi:MAG: bifunctional 2-keto-4-hydroxyglutarate aldolase/2-keto-3-deoxy-6-phosphogluconate aldolase [Clostridia bacterium]
MKKEQIIESVVKNGLIVVVRAESADQAYRITDACMEGGVKLVEITFTVKGAHHIIEELANRYNEKDLLLGAGTVLDAETARTAMLSGAQYIISPYFDLPTVTMCHRYRVPVMPGCMTPREIATATEAGVDLIKIFPGEILGPEFIKAVKSPMPFLNLVVNGGVDVDNAAGWIKAGACAVGVGGNITKFSKTGDYRKVTATAKEILAKIKEAKGE